MLTLKERLTALEKWGQHLQQPQPSRQAAMDLTTQHNGWFTAANQEAALQALVENMLEPAALANWVEAYEWPTPHAQLPVLGLVMAGNIPLVGFHDVLCAFGAGYRAQIKLSDKDQYLLPALVAELTELEPRAADYFQFVERLHDYAVVLATGSNNSARYFEHYFGRVPHLIRKNRNGVAVLTGQENLDDFLALGQDVFQYFGLGCRNVAKLYVPIDYDFSPLLEAFEQFKAVVEHPKYKNNFDYNYALYLLNREPFLTNGGIMLREDPGFSSRIGVLHYAYYPDVSSLQQELQVHAEAIQCVVTGLPGLVLEHSPVLPFGTTQRPGLRDYPDGVDTLAFLLQTYRQLDFC